jgi:hypothetical protein
VETSFSVDAWFVSSDITLGLEVGSTQGETKTRANERSTSKTVSNSVTFPSQVGLPESSGIHARYKYNKKCTSRIHTSVVLKMDNVGRDAYAQVAWFLLPKRWGGG